MRILRNQAEKLWCERCDQVLCTTHISVGVETPLGYTVGVFALCDTCANELGIDLNRVENVMNNDDNDAENDRLDQERDG